MGMEKTLEDQRFSNLSLECNLNAVKHKNKL